MANISTLTASKAWAPDQNVFNPSDAVPDALILEHSTISGIIEGDAPALRVAYVTDDAAQFTAEASEIPEGEPGLDEALVHTAKITQLVRISSEQYRQAGAAQELSSSVQRAITRKANEAFLTQAAPTAPAVAPSAGLLNVDGIESGDSISTNLDPLVDLVATLESNGGTPSGIILDPLAWAALRKLKTGTGSEVGILGAGTSDAAKLLLDLPVTISNSLTANSGLVVDSTAIVSAVGPVNLATSDVVYFTSDGVGLRATWRIGWTVVKADRIGKFTVETE